MTHNYRRPFYMWSGQDACPPIMTSEDCLAYSHEESPDESSVAFPVIDFRVENGTPDTNTNQREAYKLGDESSLESFIYGRSSSNISKNRRNISSDDRREKNASKRRIDICEERDSRYRLKFRRMNHDPSERNRYTNGGDDGPKASYKDDKISAPRRSRWDEEGRENFNHGAERSNTTRRFHNINRYDGNVSGRRELLTSRHRHDVRQDRPNSCVMLDRFTVRTLTLDNLKRKITPPTMIDPNIKKILLKYGVSKKIIDLLPSELLIKFKSLDCHLCSVNVTNTVSAIEHYNSPNHSKKMLKWLKCPPLVLKQQVSEDLLDMLTSKVKKPQDALSVWCELCGVQLTSLSEARVHVMGKKHRGVLTGKKPPKCLKINFENSKEKLRKMLQATSELEKEVQKPQIINASSPATNTQLPIDPISIQSQQMHETPIYEDPELSQPFILQHLQPFKLSVDPKLYCKICHVTVNRDQQMVYHKNGKKHLAKEKLNNMKVAHNNAQNNPALINQGMCDLFNVPLQTNSPNSTVEDDK